MGLTTTSLSALVVIALVVFAASRDWLKLSTQLGQRAARLSVIAGALLAAWVSLSVGISTEPVAVLDLEPGASASFPIIESSSAMLVSGLLPPVSSGKNASGSFLLGLYDGDTPVAHFKGQLEEHWIKGKVGRQGSTTSLVSHLEQRIQLPATAIGRALELRLDAESGELHSPLHVEVIHAPPRQVVVLGIGAAVAVVGALADTVDRRRTHVAIWATLLSAFADFMLDGITPHGPAAAVLGAAFAALIAGTAGGLLLRSFLFGLVRPRASGT